MRMVPLLLFCFSFQYSHAQSGPTGVWRGSSLCQVKNSPCHDEVVVYHISKGKDSTYEIQMNKIVNGIEEEMGVLPCSYDSSHTLRSTAFNGIWVFQLKEGKLEGTLMFRGQLYRIISLSRKN
jgi:hypothetical protein